MTSAAEPVVALRPRAGDLVAGYEVRSLLGAGGMGEIYRVRVRRAGGFEQHLAMKVMHAGKAGDPEWVALFLDEARITAQVRSEHVVKVLDTGVERGLPWLVMELVEGGSLGTWVDAGLAPPAVLYILACAARGLHAAHVATDARGRALEIVHRDVSPGNILVGREGAVKVADFGIAAARARLAPTTTGDVRGKIGYLAPELLEGRGRRDPAIDVWAFGVTAWESLEGRSLFLAPEASTTLARVASLPIPKLSSVVDEPVRDLVDRCLSRDPALRPSMDTVAEVLSRAAMEAGCGSAEQLRKLLAGCAVPNGEVALDASAEAEATLPPRAASELPSAGAAQSGVRQTAGRRRWALGLTVLVASLVTAGVGLGLPGASAPSPEVPPRAPTTSAASSELDGSGEFAPQRAIDGRASTAWCSRGGEAASHAVLGAEEFDDYWEVEFSEPRTLGALFMRTGRLADGSEIAPVPETVRDFVWAARSVDSDSFRALPGTRRYADRQQIVLRLDRAMQDVAALRLYVRRASRDRGRLAPACVREVTFAERVDHPFEVEPWFLVLDSEDDAGMDFLGPLAFPTRQVIADILTALGGGQGDVAQRVWLGELIPERRIVDQFSSEAPSCHRVGARRLVTAEGPIDDCTIEPTTRYPSWVLDEPAPTGAFVTGNARYFHDREWRLTTGLRALLRSAAGLSGEPERAVLAEGGGMSLLAMAAAHGELEDYAREFSTESVGAIDSRRVYHLCHHLLGIAGDDPALACGESTSGSHRRPPPYVMSAWSSRRDELLRGLPERFPVYEGHVGTLDVARAEESGFRAIVSYAGATELRASADFPSPMQAIRLASADVYGTQFAFSSLGADLPCEARDELRRSAEAVLRNFVLLAMDLGDERHGARMSAGSEPLRDGDLASALCEEHETEVSWPSDVRVGFLLADEEVDASANHWEMQVDEEGALRTLRLEPTEAPLWSPARCAAVPAPSGVRLYRVVSPPRSRRVVLRTRGCVRELTLLPALSI